jgi:glycosyltransferase involved in cell wall biosynthesis
MRVTLVDLWGWEAMLHYVSQLSNFLARINDVQVTLLLPRGRSYDATMFEPTVALEYVDVVKDDSMRELLSVPIKLLKLPRFLKTIQRTRPDVIHLNNCHVWHILTLPWLKQRYPVVSTMHDVEPHPGQDDTWRKRREIASLARFSNQIFVHGEKIKQQLLSKYPTRTGDEVTVIPIGNFSFFTQYEGNRIDEEDVVLFFGRIRAYKGLEYLIQAAKLVAPMFPETRFVIAGAGDFRPYHKLVGNGINFEIHNRYIPDDQVASFFRRAKVVVLPYIQASQSAVIPIACAFEKPVVTTRVGSLPEAVVDGRTGLLVPPSDASALAEAIIRLLSDDELRATLGRNSYQQMEEQLGWEAIASTTLHVYQAAMREFYPY